MFPLQLIWFSKRSFLFFLLLSFVTGSLLSLLFSHSGDIYRSVFEPRKDAAIVNDSADAREIRRIEGYNLIKPIVSAGTTRESTSFSPLKMQLEGWIDSLKKAGKVTAISVYIESLEDETWTVVNREEMFYPASFLKVPLMIGFLQKVQKNPALLEEVVVFERYGDSSPNTVYFTPEKELVPGQKYKLREILEYMIEYSDNYASRFLSKYVEFEQVQKLFTDLSIKAADPQRMAMKMNAVEFSAMMKSIFNASLLNAESSEYAAEILARCAFKDGFKKGLPSGTKMWHKFGEWNHPETEFELNESGVIFIKDKPYLLTVLTKGKDMRQLPGVIEVASRRVAGYLDNA